MRADKGKIKPYGLINSSCTHRKHAHTAVYLKPVIRSSTVVTFFSPPLLCPPPCLPPCLPASLPALPPSETIEKKVVQLDSLEIIVTHVFCFVFSHNIHGLIVVTRSSSGLPCTPVTRLRPPPTYRPPTRSTNRLTPPKKEKQDTFRVKKHLRRRESLRKSVRSSGPPTKKKKKNGAPRGKKRKRQKRI